MTMKNYMTNGEMREVMTAVIGSIPENERMNLIKNIVDDNEADTETKMRRISGVMKAIRLSSVPANGAADTDNVNPVQRYNRIPFDKKRKMIDYYYEHEGVTYTQVAEKFNVPRGTFCYIMAQHKKSIRESQQTK